MLLAVSLLAQESETFAAPEMASVVGAMAPEVIRPDVWPAYWMAHGGGRSLLCPVPDMARILPEVAVFR